MSGIVGLWNLDGRMAAPEEIARMVNAIAYRGPDGRRTIVHGPAALGFLHLETQVKPVPVCQPFLDSQAGLAIVLDGRLDNRGELAPVLEARGLHSPSGSDAEWIVRAYQLWGVEAPAHLLGDFAFAIWDSAHQRFFCARDQLGVKPFSFHHAPGSLFAFGTDLNGILALDRVPRRLNEFRLADYLVEVLDREDTVGTFNEGIQRLPGGHCLIAKRDSVHVWRYWDPPSREEEQYGSIEECAEAFRDLLLKATSDRMRDTGRVACALSGGLDSGSVVAVARELAGGPAQANLETFSLVNPEDRETVEMIRSEVDQGGLDSRLVSPEDVTAENYDLAGFIRSSDEPFNVDQGWFDRITYQVAHRHGHRVLLDGLDGDQINPDPFYLSSLLRRGHWPAAIRDARGLSSEWKEPVWRILARYGLRPIFPGAAAKVIGLRNLAWKPPADSSLDCIDEDLARRTHLAERSAERRQSIQAAARDPVFLHATAFTSGLVSFAFELRDKVAALHAIELRHPFADRRIAEFLISLPLEQKSYYPASKTLLRQAMRGFMPEPVLRQRRLPHPGPAFHARILDCHADWLQSSLQRALTSLRGYVKMGSIQRLCQTGSTDSQSGAGFALWNLAVLADWMHVNHLNNWSCEGP